MEYESNFARRPTSEPDRRHYARVLTLLYVFSHGRGIKSAFDACAIMKKESHGVAPASCCKERQVCHLFSGCGIPLISLYFFFLRLEDCCSLQVVCSKWSALSCAETAAELPLHHFRSRDAIALRSLPSMFTILSTCEARAKAWVI